MMAAGKIFKVLLLLIITVSAILIAASFILQDRVAELVIGSINKNLSVKIEVGNFRLSLLKKFPKASLGLKDIIVFSSPGFNKDEFKEIEPDTLLSAATLSVDFKITDIIKGFYDIERIGIRDGKIILLADSAGKVNYRLAEKKKDSDTGEMSINLERIFLSDVKITYCNLAKGLILDGEVKNGRLSSRLSGDNINLTADADLLISGFQQGNIRITNPFNAGLELKMEGSESGLSITKGILSVEGIRFSTTGFISAENLLDLNFTGDHIDLARIRKYLPAEYLKRLTGYDLSGSMQIKCKVGGRLSSTLDPHVEFNTILTGGGVVYRGTGMIIRNISFTGFFSNGSGNSQETSTVSIKDIKAKIGSGDYRGQVSIRNFKAPFTELQLQGRVFPGELKQFFRIKDISVAAGYCDLDLRLKTDYWPADSITTDDLLSLGPEAALIFNSLSIGFRDSTIAVNNINGNLLISGSLKADDLTFDYRGQKIGVDGKFTNLPEWLAGHPVQLVADADFSFDKLFPETFAIKKEKRAGEKKVFTMPQDLLLNLRLKIDMLYYDRLPSSDIYVNLVYKPGLLTFNSFKMKSLNGSISGNGFVAQNSTGSFMTKGNFNISGVNINNTFSTFNNFGQDFLKAENIAGNLTGSLTLLLPLDSLLKPQIKSVVAEGKYVISDGALIDFEPVRQLSSFIELSDLENIRFDKLENDFFIRNYSLYIPQMEVKSSAADLSVNGKHDFNNTFEYHVKVRLSEILSKKRKKTRRSNTEFGVVEDDGLGRTSILLKIESKGDEIKVGYDLKAAGDKVKSSIKSERQSLRTILNQEYGLYKSDTIPEQKATEKKPRFSITWDESDTPDKEPEPVSVKKENTIRSLLKKK
jgi:hypothetical protein